MNTDRFLYGYYIYDVLLIMSKEGGRKKIKETNYRQFAIMPNVSRQMLKQNCTNNI
jgi:hypothetical protein